MSEILIVDYEMGNLRSVSKALEHVGAKVRITADPNEARRADKLVLPGVGAFGDAMTALRKRGLDEAVKDFVAGGRPFLGICLGLQLLFDEGLELGRHQGLGIVKGRCVALPEQLVEADGRRLKVPHMGWNSLEIVRRSPVLAELPNGAEVYFVHSYVVEPADAAVVSTVTEYGGKFVSSIWRDNVCATQFHPEKSQVVGLKILANFAKL